jgi:hypothetical protein
MIRGELINIMKPHRLATIKAKAMLFVKCSISGLFDGDSFSRHEKLGFLLKPRIRFCKNVGTRTKSFVLAVTGQSEFSVRPE